MANPVALSLPSPMQGEGPGVRVETPGDVNKLAPSLPFPRSCVLLLRFEIRFWGEGAVVRKRTPG